MQYDCCLQIGGGYQAGDRGPVRPSFPSSRLRHWSFLIGAAWNQFGDFAWNPSEDFGLSREFAWNPFDIMPGICLEILAWTPSGESAWNASGELCLESAWGFCLVRRCVLRELPPCFFLSLGLFETEGSVL